MILLKAVKTAYVKSFFSLLNHCSTPQKHAMIPMKFGDGKNEISDFWKKYYADLALPVPLNQPGTNPEQLSKSALLDFIGTLE